VESSPAFVGEPEGNGVVEWFIRQLKEQVIWPRRFRTIEELRKSVLEFVDRFNQKWLVERLGYRSPKEAYSSYTISREVAA
jgi:transposase InsO family protein